MLKQLPRSMWSARRLGATQGCGQIADGGEKIDMGTALTQEIEQVLAKRIVIVHSSPLVMGFLSWDRRNRGMDAVNAACTSLFGVRRQSVATTALSVVEMRTH